MSMDAAGPAAALRLELKRWEKAFANANEGRKPSRDDIKKDATISAKYKQYQKYQNPQPQEQTTPKKSSRIIGSKLKSTPLKERSSNSILLTPRNARAKRDGQKAAELGTVWEDEPTPACIRCALGPTPQKDGEVLGIFDLYPGATPSKPETISNSILAAPMTTPSKHSTTSGSHMAQLSRTPQSSGKRFYLDTFAGTPLKRKAEDDLRTPSTSKRQFATPAFLRRHTLPIHWEADGENETTAPAPPPFKKRGFVRSLSSIIQGLRRQESERLDDDMAVMLEMEAEEAGGKRAVVKPAPAILRVEDSHTIEMALGPDGAGNTSDEEDDPLDPGALDANGNPRKVWKKKGLKRQTKRVIMRPVLHRPQKEAKDNQQDSDGVSDDQEPDQDGTDSPRKAKLKPANTESNVNGNGTGNTTGRKRKLNVLAHTNFRKLKIKNKNSKAKGRGGRFGRK